MLRLLALGLSCVLTGVGAAAAQGSLDAQRFLPAPGEPTGFGVEQVEVPSHRALVVALAGSYARAAVELPACSVPARRDEPGCVAEAPVVLLDSLTQFELLAALGLFETLELSLAVPLAAAQVADDFEQPSLRAWEVGLAPIRLGVKMPLIRGRAGLAARLWVGLPTASGDLPFGSRAWTLSPALVGGVRVAGLSLALRLSYLRRNRAGAGALLQDDEVGLALAAKQQLWGPLSAVVEGRLEFPLAVEARTASRVVEALGGLRFALGQVASLDLAVGARTWPGVEGAVGAPRWRLLAMLRYGDGRGACAFGPEDEDGFQDDDYCADPDNDGDGIPDGLDLCVDDAEDLDGFADRDGCPDFDNDADGLADADDACPTKGEDRDGFQDGDGCPEPDNDQDRVADVDDRCPMDPEDPDSFEDGDGCPEPGPEPLSVTVTDSRILISERVFFEFDRDVVRPVSFPLLNEIARVIGELGQDVVVQVEGHTDDTGNPDYNLDLSYLRARAVVTYLRAQGVPEARLSYRGFGASRPLTDDPSPAGRALNRRVEFRLQSPD